MAKHLFKNSPYGELDHKKLNFDVKMDESGKSEGTFSGFASTSHLDRGGDIVLKGAFKRTLKERGDSVRILWQHDSKKPIGRPTLLEERDGGLYIEGKISDTELGREAMTLLKDGVIDSMSIGYSVNDSEYNGQGVRVIKDLDLYEVSLVTFPMNEKAKVTGVKDDNLNVRDIEKVLRDAGYSRSQSKAIASAGVKCLREVDQESKEDNYLSELKTAIAELNSRLQVKS